MRHLQLSGGWKQWRRGAQWRETVRRCATMVQQYLGKALRSWQAMAEERLEALKQLQTGVGRWL